MKLKNLLLLTLFFLIGAAITVGQSKDNVNVAPNAPQDQPKQAETLDQVAKLDLAIKPYVEKARQTYPEAKRKFLAGLPPKETLFVTTRLHDSEGRIEQVFIAVKEIKDDTIKGVIWSQINTVTGYQLGDSYSMKEKDLLDWTISKPDGTEEGNFVGKFLDSYQP